MALDEALLESALEHERATLRIYRWSEPTVSLGYFQDATAAALDARLAPLPKVRRLSGGGALLHHHEITYSCAVPATHFLAVEPHDLYLAVHQRVLAVLNTMGVAARMRGERLEEREALFLCFGRGDSRDIVLAGHKILGSAQRRRRGAVLQHGALLLHRSPYTPEFPGLFDLGVEKELAAETLMDDLGMSLAGALGETGVAGGLSQAERSLALVLEEDRYCRLDWRGDRGRRD